MPGGFCTEQCAAMWQGPRVAKLPINRGWPVPGGCMGSQHEEGSMTKLGEPRACGRPSTGPSVPQRSGLSQEREGESLRGARPQHGRDHTAGGGHEAHLQYQTSPSEQGAREDRSVARARRACLGMWAGVESRLLKVQMWGQRGNTFQKNLPGSRKARGRLRGAGPTMGAGGLDGET